jgi:hypothetical protein
LTSEMADKMLALETFRDKLTHLSKEELRVYLSSLLHKKKQEQEEGTDGKDGSDLAE